MLFLTINNLNPVWNFQWSKSLKIFFIDDNILTRTNKNKSFCLNFSTLAGIWTHICLPCESKIQRLKTYVPHQHRWQRHQDIFDPVWHRVFYDDKLKLNHHSSQKQKKNFGHQYKGAVIKVGWIWFFEEWGNNYQKLFLCKFKIIMHRRVLMGEQIRRYQILSRSSLQESAIFVCSYSTSTFSTSSSVWN